MEKWVNHPPTVGSGGVCDDDLGGDGDDDDGGGREREEAIWRSGSTVLTSFESWKEAATRMNNAELASCTKYFLIDTHRHLSQLGHPRNLSLKTPFIK